MTEYLGQRFDKRVAVVTGASGGIGQAIAVRLATEGATVALVARRAARLEEVAHMLAQDGRRALPVPCDLTDTTAVEEAVSLVVTELGGVDVLVNCVGREQVAPFVRLDDRLIDDAVRVNLWAPLVLTREVGRHMIRRQMPGSVVNIASVVGQVGVSGTAVYGAAKAAIVGWTRCLALEWATHRIRVNAIAPGWVRTEMFDRLATRLQQDELAQLELAHPLGFGDPADVAAVAAFLASDETRWITGSVLTVDGGYSAR